jgi:hypothetical protein
MNRGCGKCCPRVFRLSPRVLIDLADQSDLLAIDLRFKLLLEIISLGPRHFRCDMKRHLRGARDADRGLWTTFDVVRGQKL